MKTMLKAPPIVLIAMSIALFMLEFFVLPVLEHAGLTSGARWREEDKKLFQMNLLRNSSTDENAVWRSALHQPRQHPGRPRILVVGDSLVWGDGYANANDLWWRLLERDLHRRGYRESEVCAVGRCGLTMKNALSPAKRAIEELKPDIIIWSYIPNNANEGVIERPPISRLESVTKHFRFLLPQVCNLLNSKLAEPVEEILSTYSGAPKNPKIWEKQLLKGENFARLKNTMCRLADLFTVYDRPSVVVLLPIFPIDGYYEPRFEPIKTFLSLANVPVLDLSYGYRGWFEKESKRLWKAGKGIVDGRFLWIHPANMHPSPALGQYYSTIVAEHLLREYPSCFNNSSRASVLPKEPKENAQSCGIEINDCMPPYLLTRLEKTKEGYRLLIPNSEHQLVLPLGRPFVQLNMREPEKIGRVELRGKALRSARILVSTESCEFERDLGELVDLGAQSATVSKKGSGSSLKWMQAGNDPINTIRIADVQFSEPGCRQIEILFESHQ